MRKYFTSFILFFVTFFVQSQPDFKNTEPEWSPDGKLIAFCSMRDGVREIYVMNADGSNQQRLTTTGGSMPRWSSDGKQVMFLKKVDGRDKIFLMNSDGSGQRPLTSWNVLESFGEWDPKGSRIAFMAAVEKHTQIYLFNSDGSMPTQIAKVDMNLTQPVWSPDGRFIVSTSFGLVSTNLKTDLENGKSEIFLSNKGSAQFIGWTKNMDKIFFKKTTFTPGQPSFSYIYSANADGSKATKVSKKLTGAYSLMLSPDDNHIAYENKEAAFVIDLVSNTTIKVGDKCHSVRWSPDGKSLVMVSRDDMNIFTVNADGTSRKQLTF